MRRSLICVAATGLVFTAAAFSQPPPKLIGQVTKTGGFGLKATASGRIPFDPAKVMVRVSGHSADDKLLVGYSLTCTTKTFTERQRSGEFRVTMPSTDSTHVKVPKGHFASCDIIVSATVTAVDTNPAVHLAIYAVPS